MTKHSSSFQGNFISTLLCFIFLRFCSPRNPFYDLDLSSQTLNPVVTGFKITGNALGDNFGRSVKRIGDINNDGYDDIIIGANVRGMVYVIYGGEGSSFLNIDLSTTTLNPLTTGFMITGNAVGDYFGYTVSTAGDINNDGYDDIIVGAVFKDSARGAAYVIYGGKKSSMSNIDLSTQTLNPLVTGFIITGSAAYDNLGISVSTAGDINNDGYADIIVGTYGKNSAQGAAYVIYGGAKSTMSNINLSSTPLSPASTGFMIAGNAAGDRLGFSVGPAGDINNDGYDDIIVGASTKSNNKGAAYVIYGGGKSTMSNIILSSTALNPPTTGFMITGNAVGDNLGVSVSTAGDINNDGYDDIIVGAYGKNSIQGAAYVIYGGPKSTMSNWDFSSSATLNPLTTGFMISGSAAGDFFGYSVSRAGDINNDGYDDIIIGAPGKDSKRGAAYVIYGGEKSTMSNIILSSQTLNPLTTGFMVMGNAARDEFGWSVSTAGDLNDDGYNDIVVGAVSKNAAYLIYASCSENCKQCSSESVCNECKNPYFMSHSECFASCPDATLAISSTTCSDCPAYCNHCSSTSECTECINPFVLADSQCFASCPKAMFNENKVCKDCPPYCASCISQDSCQVCYQGYTLSNSLCVLSSDSSQEKAYHAISSATQGIGSVICVGSTIFPFSALVSKIVQNTRYLNLSVTSDLAQVYQTWDTDLISWDVPNVMSNLDHFETSPALFARYNLGSPFLMNFWPTLLNIGIGFGTFISCIFLQKILEHEKYEGWAYSLVRKLVAESFNFALIQAYACLDDILFYLVLDAKTNPFNSFFSWTSMISAVIFLVLGCLLVFFNFWTVNKYQSIKNQGAQGIEAFNERNKYWELFYADFNDDNLWSQAFFAIAIIRSALSSLITTVLSDYPLMQTTYFVMMDIAIISFLYLEDPFNTLRGKLAQYYYEIITLLVHFCTFILSLQDTFKSSSETVRLIMSTGILYLNTALVSGAIGFMFIEIYKTISEKKRAARLKKPQSIPEDTQETQNFTLQSSETGAHKRQDWNNTEQTESIENYHLESGNNRNLVSSDFNMESSQGLESNFYVIESEMNPSKRIQRHGNQSPVPIMVRQRPQGQQRKCPRHSSFKKNLE